MNLLAALAIARTLHYLACSVLFGAALFPLYGFAAGSVAAEDRRSASLRPWLVAAAALALVSGFGWFAVTRAMEGGGLVWSFRLALLFALLLLVIPRRGGIWREYALIGGSGALIAGIALVGHPGHETVAGIPLRAFHLLAAGVWIGALAVFARWASGDLRRHSEGDLRALYYALEHFAGIGTVIVATLIVSGVLLIGAANSSALYMQVLIGKLVLFGGMLVLASVNRFWLTPRLVRALDRGVDIADAVAALRASLAIETALAMLVLAAVGVLGVA